jgi:hypothetical protein
MISQAAILHLRDAYVPRCPLPKKTLSICSELVAIRRLEPSLPQGEKALPTLPAASRSWAQSFGECFGRSWCGAARREPRGNKAFSSLSSRAEETASNYDDHESAASRLSETPTNHQHQPYQTLRWPHTRHESTHPQPANATHRPRTWRRTPKSLTAAKARPTAKMSP